MIERTHIVLNPIGMNIIEGLKLYPAHNVYLIINTVPDPSVDRIFKNLNVVHKKIIDLDTEDYPEILRTCYDIIHTHKDEIYINMTDADYRYVTTIYYLIPLFTDRKFIPFDINGLQMPVPLKNPLSEREKNIITILTDTYPIPKSGIEIAEMIMEREKIGNNVSRKAVALQYRYPLKKLESIGYIKQKNGKYIITDIGRLISEVITQSSD